MGLFSFGKEMKSEKGISLIECLMVVVVMGLIVFLIGNIPNAVMLLGKSKHLSLAREIAVKQIEGKRTINYANLVDGNTVLADTRLSLLPQGAGAVEIADCDSAICTNGEPVKQITVTVSWVDNNKPQTLSLKTMIGAGGINQ